LGACVLKTEDIKNVEKKRRIQAGAKPKSSGRGIVLLAVAVFVSIVYIVYLNRYNPVISSFLRVVVKEEIVQKSSIIEIDTSLNYDVGIYKGNVVLCNNDGIKAVNQKGEEEWSIALSLSKPIMKINDKYVLVADKGGREVNIVTNYSVLCTVRTDEPIVTASINNAGYFAVVTDEKGHKGRITVYDANSNGQEIYKWYSGQNYITDVVISKNNDRMVVSTIDTTKGKVSGGVVFFSFNQEKPYAGILKEDTLISNLQLCKDNTVLAIGDNQMLGFSLDGQEKWSYNYDGRQLETYDMDANGVTVLALSEKNGKTAIEIINNDGKLKGNKEVDGDVKYIDIGHEFVAFNSKRDIFLLTQKGEEVAKAVSNRDVVGIQLFGNSKEILLISRNALDIMELKR